MSGAALARALDRMLGEPRRGGPARAAAFTAGAVVPQVVAAYERARATSPAA